MELICGSQEDEERSPNQETNILEDADFFEDKGIMYNFEDMKIILISINDFNFNFR